MVHLLAPEVVGELDEIWYYIAKESGSVDAADRLIDSITDRFFILASHPYAGRSRSDTLRPGVRSFPTGEYVVIYQIEGEDVLILHVLRSSRDIEVLFGLR